MVVGRSSTPSLDAEETPTIPLFWRLFVPNACVLVVACVVLIVEPANGRIIALVGGLAIMLAVNLLLMRRAFAPLTRLMATMNRVDPLRPGERVPVVGPPSEVTVLAREFNAMLDRIETERRESAHRMTVAEDSERRHLATELHDEIGQTLTALVLQISRIKAKGGSPEDLEEALATAESALEDIRRLARRLRPEVLDELGLTAALTTLCNRLSSQTGLVIHRTLPEAPPPLTPDEQLVVYRIVQESLTNVIRHSGASEARVTLHTDADRVEVAVVDDGRGLPADGVPLAGGIRSMRERALQIGADVTWRTAEPGGTMIQLRIPVRTGER
jgi:two-component system, NarL family, sensor histidine kinase UhpB